MARSTFAQANILGHTPRQRREVLITTTTFATHRYYDYRASQTHDHHELESQHAALQRSFYLTPTTHDTLTALQACASGFHTANIYEIYDPTGLRYDTQLGLTSNDSGSGPPASGSIHSGWVRSGRVASNLAVGGIGNCQAFQSNDPLDVGHTATLTSFPVIGPWQYLLRTCDEVAPVWCVSD